MSNVIEVTFKSTVPVKLHKWKVREGMAVAARQLLMLYENVPPSVPSHLHKYKGNDVGTISKICVNEGDFVKPGCVILHLEKCKHPTVMKDMCAECGADLRQAESPQVNASVPMVHSIPELKVSQELAMTLGKADEMRLQKDRKLVLLVDLDQTLIHTTNDNIPPNLKDVVHFQLYGPHSPWYHTRIRPGTERFLEAVSELYELHICTFGARNYAHYIALFLDPDGRFFSHRILSRDECFDANSKTANLKALFPCGDSMVCIIDDREDVWNYAPNLIHVKPYHFFQHTGDINAPPGLTKKDNDTTEQGFDFTTLGVKNKSEEALDKKATIPNLSRKKTLPSGETTTDKDTEDEKEVKTAKVTGKRQSEADNSSDVSRIHGSPIELEKNDCVDAQLVQILADEKMEGDVVENNDLIMKDSEVNSEESGSNISRNDITEKDKDSEHSIQLNKEGLVKGEDNIRQDEIVSETKIIDAVSGQIEENTTKLVLKTEETQSEISENLNSVNELDLYAKNSSELLEKDRALSSQANGSVSEKDEIMKDSAETNCESNASNLEVTRSTEEIINEEIPKTIEDDENIKKKDEFVEKASVNDANNDKFCEDGNIVSKEGENTFDDSPDSKKAENITKTSTNATMKDKMMNNDEIIEVEDSDDYLLYLEDILRKIHDTYYRKYDNRTPKDPIPDLKTVIPDVKKRILAGCHLVFSGLVPSHVPLQRSRAYAVALSLGATVENEVSAATTHLVAARAGTAKVNSSRRQKGVNIVTPHWLWHCAERWERVDERLYPLARGVVTNRHPPAHCGSPQHPGERDVVAAPRVRTDSGRFSDTINPLLSFSSEEMLRMDQEVEALCADDTDSEESASEKAIRSPVLPINQSDSSSCDSMTGGSPKGWSSDGPRAKKRKMETTTCTESDLEEDSPCAKFRRGEPLSSDLDLGEESPDDTQDSQDGDDAAWNLMGAALEREFLSGD